MRPGLERRGAARRHRPAGPPSELLLCSGQSLPAAWAMILPDKPKFIQSGVDEVGESMCGE